LAHGRRQGPRRSAYLCSGSEAGSYLRPIDFVYHSTLGLRVIKKKETRAPSTSSVLRIPDRGYEVDWCMVSCRVHNVGV